MNYKITTSSASGSLSIAPIDAFWHIANFLAPAITVAAIASVLAKLLWRSDLRRVAWFRLFAWAAGVCAGVLIARLVVFGRDGRMATYAAMVVGCAIALWGVGFARR